MGTSMQKLGGVSQKNSTALPSQHAETNHSCEVLPALSSFLFEDRHSSGLPSCACEPQASGSGRGPADCAPGRSETAQMQLVPCRSHGLEELRHTEDLYKGYKIY